MPPAPTPPPPAIATAVGVPAAPGASAPPPFTAPPPPAPPPPAPIAASIPGSHGPSSASRLPLPAPDGVASPPPGQVPFDIPPLPPADVSLSPWQPLAEFAKLSLKRAFRVRIDPNEITPDERTTLDKAGVVFPSLRSFLAWRRSVLFGFATFLGVLVILRAIEVFDKDNIPPYLRDGGSTIQALSIVGLLVDAAFCGLCWWQWTRWTEWKKQRTMLGLGWLAYFFVPFVLSLYPLRTTLSTGEDKSGATMIGMVFAIQTLMVLAPRALAFLPGTARAATATKLLFPQSPVPGWMMVALTPLHALFLVVVLLIPYQVTGSGFYILALGGFLGGAYFVTRAAWELRGPTDREQATRVLARTRTGYYIALGVGVVFLLVALAELIDQLDFKPITVVNLVGVGIANIWILTLVATDQMIAHLEAGKHIDGFRASGPPPG